MANPICSGDGQLCRTLTAWPLLHRVKDPVKRRKAVKADPDAMELSDDEDQSPTSCSGGQAADKAAKPRPASAAAGKPSKAAAGSAKPVAVKKPAGSDSEFEPSLMDRLAGGVPARQCAACSAALLGCAELVHAS